MQVVQLLESRKNKLELIALPFPFPDNAVMNTTNPPTYLPTYLPTYILTYQPLTNLPTHLPTYLLTYLPTYQPLTNLPTYLPTYQHTYLPTYPTLPTYLPTYQPLTYLPTYLLTYLPTYLPTYQHTDLPTYLPLSGKQLDRIFSWPRAPHNLSQRLSALLIKNWKQKSLPLTEPLMVAAALKKKEQSTVS